MFFIAGFTIGVLDSSVHMLAENETLETEPKVIRFTLDVNKAKRFKSQEHAEKVITPIVTGLAAGKSRHWKATVVNLLNFEVYSFDILEKPEAT